MIKKTGGGLYNENSPPIYFTADVLNAQRPAKTAHNYKLIALSSIRGETTIKTFENVLAHNVIFLDSGTYDMAIKQSKLNGTALQDTFKQDPQTFKNFEKVFDNYVKTVKKYETQLWGYIEIDLGNIEHKQSTRARLENCGLSPIPVYNVHNDPVWYLEKLALTYDRVCIGGLVKELDAKRHKIITVLEKYFRKYKNTWFHVLGYTPDAALFNTSVESADSSAWISSIKFPLTAPSDSSLSGATYFTKGWTYNSKISKESIGGSHHALEVGYYRAHFLQENWRAFKKYELQERV